MLWLNLDFKVNAIILVLIGLGANIGGTITEEASILIEKKNPLL